MTLRALLYRSSASERGDGRPKLVFLSPYDPRDPTRWSGTINSIYLALRRRDPELRHISGSLIDLAVRAVGQALRRFGLVGDLRFSKPFARFVGLLTSLRLAAIGADAVVAVAASNYLAFLWTRAPIIYISDATFASIARIYPEFAAFPAWLRRHGDEVERRAIEGAAHVIYPSGWAKSSAVRDYGACAGKIEVTPFGPNLRPEVIDRFCTVKSADFDRPVRLLYVSSDWARKGGDLAVAIAEALRRRGLPCEIYLVGQIPPQIKESETVHPVGPLDKRRPDDVARLCALFERADFFVLPTGSECSAIVFSEAGAFGCPSITFDVGGTADAVIDGETGIVLQPTATAADFADRIQALVQDRRAYETMSRNARRRYEQSANWDVWADLIFTLAARDLSRQYA